ncbi:MAG: hypothetical protein HY699_23485 [Deltaproteobacteria bacterium]|nr:hypothetical protein [Deltaproteobacteria bacterium]
MARAAVPKGRRGQPRRRFFDDPSLRVDLAESFRADLRQQKQASLAAKVRSPRARRSRDAVAPSSVSRYAAGKIAPTLRMARQLAAALGRPLVEAVAGFAPQHARPTPSWAQVLLTSRTYRAQAAELISMFSNVLNLIHLGVVADRERQHRRTVRPAEGTPGYRYFEIALASPVPPGSASEFLLSYQLFDAPPVFVDYARVQLTPREVRGVELWTNRSFRKRLSKPAARVWVQTWIDGKATDFVVRSSRPFTLSPFVSRQELPRPRVVVPFRPCGIHQHAQRAGR